MSAAFDHLACCHDLRNAQDPDERARIEASALRKILDAVDARNADSVTNDRLEFESARTREVLRGEMAVLRGDMRAEMISMKGDLRSEIAELRESFQKARLTQLKWLIGMVVAILAAMARGFHWFGM